MKSFFVIASTGGRPVPQSELDRCQAIIDRSITYAGFVQSARSCISEQGSVWLFALTNEPEVTPLLEQGDTVLALSGDCYDLPTLQRLRPTDRLAMDISGITGRFSAVVMDRRSGEVAVANSAVRIDSIFTAEGRGLHFIGTQASTLCELLHGELRYDVDAMYTLISSGFFGTDATSFRGVSVLPPLTTWILGGDGGGKARRHTTHLGELKESPGRADDVVDACLDAYLDAVRPIAQGPQPVVLALSGGKDSRLVLTALRRAGIDVSCYTIDRGADNSAEVYVATELARLLELKHQVRPAERVESDGDESAIRVDLLHRTVSALRASDGAVFGYDRAYFRARYSPQINLTGHGGEVMRGGYAERYDRPLRSDEVPGIAKALFIPAPDLFRWGANRRYTRYLTDWVEDHAARMPPHDVLDCLYVHFRCGRWVAATTRGTTTSAARLFPFLDNRLALALVRAPAAQKVKDQVIREIVRRLDARAADFPLANDHWRNTSKEERRRTEQAHPAAFARASDKVNLDWRLHIEPPLLDHIRQYCLGDGRAELLSSIVDLSATRKFLDGVEAARPSKRRVLFGLYAACALTSGDWLKTPFPEAPVQIRAAVGPAP
ncbi:MAG TPA: asparagine synthase C-terminal domain-containing protein [Kofleriaceae bacterium]|nr:asparagine synthase C-terminal domain-containing protein [Kofleriaceae bacterium]